MRYPAGYWGSGTRGVSLRGMNDERARQHRAVRWLAGAAGAGAIAGAALTLESLAWPYAWLRILIAIWALPPILVGFAAGCYVVEYLAQAPRPQRETSWRWFTQGAGQGTGR